MPKSRYLYYYQHLVCDTLILSHNVRTPMDLPYLKGLVCVASCDTDTSQLVTKGALELTLAQRGASRLAKKSIAAFNLREMSVVSCQVTLRQAQLYVFLDLLATFVMPSLSWNRENNIPSSRRAACHTISFGLSNFLDFPLLEPYFPQFESAKGCNINIMINPKSIRVTPSNFTHIWAF